MGDKRVPASCDNDRTAVRCELLADKHDEPFPRSDKPSFRRAPTRRGITSIRLWYTSLDLRTIQQS